MEQTIENIKEGIKKQKTKLEYIFNFIEEIDSITDVDIILQVALLVKVKHQELLKKNNKNETLIKPTKKQSSEEVFRAKNYVEPTIKESATKQCAKCKQKKQLDDFHKNKVNKDGRQSYCIKCQKEANKESKAKKSNYEKHLALKKSRKQIDAKISINKNGIFVPAYETTITPEDIATVMKTMQKVEYGFIPTAESLAEETGFKIFKVRAILLYLQGMNRIKRAYGGTKGKVRYEVVLA